MQKTLDDWQRHLEAHFASLAASRAGSGFPLFGLEHGLEANQLEDISSQLLGRLRSGARLSPHWLLWAIYATERGYAYAGDEYWQSFEEQTPYWELKDRYRLVPWFSKFQEKFGGVVPTGSWASHFRIIAWPITHAILPRYLQSQFARSLYDLRYRLAALTHLDPASIGHLLATHAHASTRFAEFLQQDALTGRLVLSLLHADLAGGQEPIFRLTLKRLVDDLEEVRQAREWLKEAKRVVSDRFKGLGHGAGFHRKRFAGEVAPDRDLSGRPSIRPDLLLRHSGSGTWSVVLNVPDFRAIATSADIRTFLRSTRCRLNGAEDVKPSGWLLGANRMGVLRTWPDPRKTLIWLEKPHGVVDSLIEADCRLSQGPPWLFRIRNDGIAQEIVGRIVRPGREYIVATTVSPPEPHGLLSRCGIACTGVNAFRVSIPAHVSANDTAWLNKIGLQVGRTIRVWPAGFPGRAWDGEGHGEFLTTESPCFGIVHDHPVEAYSLRLDDGTETVIDAGPVGHSTFIRMPRLSAGVHKLSVKARRDPSHFVAPMAPQAEGILALNVREPEPWIPGRAAHNGLVVTIDPHDADLTALWENRVRVSVVGPESHHVTCRIALRKGDGEEIFAEMIGDPMRLPVTPESWSRTFQRFAGRSDVAWRYLEAAAGRLTVSAEELGEFVANFEHQALPLRWILRSDQGKIIVRLVDDTGHEGIDPVGMFLAMGRPLLAQGLLPVDVLAGTEAIAPGGLFVAQHAAYRDVVVVSSGLSGSGLQGLGAFPEFPELKEGTVSPAEACRVLALWSTARMVGYLPEIRRQQVVEGLISALYAALCGPDWEGAERAFSTNLNTRHTLDGLQRSVDRNTGFASVLRRDYARMNQDFSGGADWYADLASRYGVCGEATTSRFALCLASQPQQLADACGAKLDDLMAELAKTPAVLRGARLLALLCANEDDARPVRLLAGWSWS